MPLVSTLAEGGLAIVALDRPDALNALTDGMFAELRAAVRSAEARGPCAIWLAGSGGRAFCAGGDIRALHRGRAAHGIAPMQEAFMRAEYSTDVWMARRSARSVPHVAVWDGVAMGGGLGISVHAFARVATTSSIVAMPEVHIGLFPDVGASAFLAALDRYLGHYLALTGHRLVGADAVHAGLATHFVRDPAALRADLAALPRGAGRDGVRACLNKHAERRDGLPPFSLRGALDAIEACFSAPTVAEVVRRVDAARAAGDGAAARWAEATLQELRRASPLSLRITFEALRRGRGLSLEACLDMEFALATRCLSGSEFYEGVRAAVIDKDRAPRWTHARVEEVGDEEVARHFDLLPGMRPLAASAAAAALDAEAPATGSASSAADAATGGAHL